MKLTKDNYFSLEAKRHYMGSSQFKSFIPAFGGCEAAAMAELRGEYEQPEKEAFWEGKYVHAWNEGTLAEFKADNPDIFSSRGPTSGQLKANFQHCNRMIETLETDPLVMKVLAGRKEVIMSAEMFGVPWKIMLDSYQPEMIIFADLKAMKDMDSKFWSKDAQCYENFIDHYGYKVQMAIYAEIERLASGRDTWLLPHMVVVTKQNPPDHDILYFDDQDIESGLAIVGQHIERVKLVKAGAVKPNRCEKCEYCRQTKKIETIKHSREFALY